MDEQLGEAIKTQNLPWVEHLISTHEYDRTDSNYLHIAIFTGNVEITQFLLYAGFDPAEDPPLYCAEKSLLELAVWRAPHLVNLLIAFGADPEIPDRFGNSLIGRIERMNYVFNYVPH